MSPLVLNELRLLSSAHLIERRLLWGWLLSRLCRTNPLGATLSLLDGRRLQNNLFNFFDLSNIPTTAIERVEVLPVGASAIYGADALGGTINIILRKDFSGLAIDGNVRHASGATDAGVNVSWGKSWEHGSVAVIGTYQARDELDGSQRAPLSSTHFPPSVTHFRAKQDLLSPRLISLARSIYSGAITARRT